MKLKHAAGIYSGHLSRKTIQADENGFYKLLQGRDVIPGVLECGERNFIRFQPKLSARDVMLKDGDVLFMARGATNYAAILQNVPDYVLASGSFFVIRVKSEKLEPGYLVWYLNQARARHYFTRNSGRGVHMPVVRRAVLEQLDMPIPPLSVQKTISELFWLSLKEERLTNRLIKKRAELLEAVCLKAAQGEKA